MEKPDGEPIIVELKNLYRDYYLLQFLVEEREEPLKREVDISMAISYWKTKSSYRADRPNNFGRKSVISGLQPSRSLQSCNDARGIIQGTPFEW